MENNIIELIIKMMQGSQFSQPQNQNPSILNYPSEASQQNNFQNNNCGNNIMPLILSLLKNTSIPNITASHTQQENKQAEVSSVDEDILL